MKPFFVLSMLLAVTVLARPFDEFVIVTHPGVGTATLSTNAWSAIFLKKTRTWPGGTPIIPLDQSERSVVRIKFTTVVHRKSVSAVRSYWHQRIFFGRDVPPIEKASDAAVVDFVRATPGAVGYVSVNALTSGVTRIVIR